MNNKKFFCFSYPMWEFKKNIEVQKELEKEDIDYNRGVDEYYKISDCKNKNKNYVPNLIEIEFIKKYNIDDKIYNRYSNKLKLRATLDNIKPTFTRDSFFYKQYIDRIYNYMICNVFPFHHLHATKVEYVDFIEEFYRVESLSKNYEHMVCSFVIKKRNFDFNQFAELKKWLELSIRRYFVYYKDWEENDEYYMVVVEPRDIDDVLPDNFKLDEEKLKKYLSEDYYGLNLDKIE